MDKISSAMQKSIKAQVRKMKCPEHGERPKVSFTSKGYSISCCCEKFRGKVADAMGDIVKRTTIQQFKDMTKDFKNLKMK